MNRRGSILVTVLLMAAILTVFIGVGVGRLHVARQAVRQAREDAVAEIVVRAAIERLFVQTAGRFGDLERPAIFHDPAADVEVTARDEAARVDLNLAPPQLLAGLFVAVGYDRDRATSYAGLVEARRRPDRGGRGPFEHVRQLDDVAGLPREAITRIEPYVTVASFTPRIAVAVADPRVVTAVPGFDRARLDAFLMERATALSFEGLVARYGFEPEHVTRRGGVTTRIAIKVHLGPHRARSFDIVVALLETDDEPYRIVSWDDTSDGAETRRPR